MAGAPELLLKRTPAAYPNEVSPAGDPHLRHYDENNPDTQSTLQAPGYSCSYSYAYSLLQSYGLVGIGTTYSPTPTLPERGAPDPLLMKPPLELSPTTIFFRNNKGIGRTFSHLRETFPVEC